MSATTYDVRLMVEGGSADDRNAALVAFVAAVREVAALHALADRPARVAVRQVRRVHDEAPSRRTTRGLAA